jgi:nitrogen-specific signal transduction histidine kinase
MADPSRSELEEVLAWTGTERLVGAIAHELGNELGVILNYVLFFKESVAVDSVAADDVRELVEAANKAAVLTRQLGLVGRGAPVDMQVFDVGTLIRELEPVLRRGLADRAGLRVSIDGALPKVRMDPGAFVRVMLAVVLARRDELDHGATLGLRVRADAASRCVRVDVQGAAVAFDPIRAGARALAAASGCRLEPVTASRGLVVLSLALPTEDG